MTAVLRQPRAWLAALLLWFGLLCGLSSLHGSATELPPVSHIDKLLHFIYFLAGGFFFAGWRTLRKDTAPASTSLIVSAAIVMACIGALDEWHQTFTPGRSGADIGDWTADLLGGILGAVLFKSVHSRLS